jgi:N-methylhydantoinase A/oxoprolinase/acetone carboxylase beta subunit
LGIAQSLDALQGVDLKTIKLVSLSTTLATNAIVEGKGCRVFLFLVGYDPALMEKFGFEKDLPTPDFCYLRGRHDLLGEEIEALDLKEAERIILKKKGQVEAFAISSYLGVRNPEHELRLRALVRKLTPHPVVCGHELTSELDSIQRAVTAVLNARLIPLLRTLILSMRKVLKRKGIQASLVLVKGDGSLVSSRIAEERPVETILSGPAASVAAAQYLSGLKEAVIVDMGGTTTDVAILREGKPYLNPRGATVGNRSTCVKGIDITTAGIGGDSRIFIGRTGDLRVGPRRVVPIGLLASQYPQVLGELKRVAAGPLVDRFLAYGEFFVIANPARKDYLGTQEKKALHFLQEGPLSLLQLSSRLNLVYPSLLNLSQLEERGIVQRCGLTPSDLLHVEGKLSLWDCEASHWASRILAKTIRMKEEDLARLVREEITQAISLQVLNKALQPDGRGAPLPGCRVCSDLLDLLFRTSAGSGPSLQIKLGRKLVAIGAPVKSFLPPVGQALGTQVLIPPHAEVGNALGAVIGIFSKTIEIWIKPTSAESLREGYSVHLPNEKAFFERLEQAKAYAIQKGKLLAEKEAKRAGAERIRIEVSERDNFGTVAEEIGEGIYLDSLIRISAFGRPAIAK